MTTQAQLRETQPRETQPRETQPGKTQPKETPVPGGERCGVLTAGRWQPRRASRLAGWLLLAVAAVATWPVAIVTAAGYAVARRRAWPATRLGRQAGWTLPMAAVWIAAESARGWRAMTLDPVRDGASGWPNLTVPVVLKTFLLVAPVTFPAGLALAAMLWAAPRRESAPAPAAVASDLDEIFRPGVPR
jgi:hypothetical protein